MLPPALSQLLLRWRLHQGKMQLIPIFLIIACSGAAASQSAKDRDAKGEPLYPIGRFRVP